MLKVATFIFGIYLNRQNFITTFCELSLRELEGDISVVLTTSIPGLSYKFGCRKDKILHKILKNSTEHQFQTSLQTFSLKILTV